jgi:hypothetical protein
MASGPTGEPGVVLRRSNLIGSWVDIVLIVLVVLVLVLSLTRRSGGGTGGGG